jgi:hypothetical protein
MVVGGKVRSLSIIHRSVGRVEPGKQPLRIDFV